MELCQACTRGAFSSSSSRTHAGFSGCGASLTRTRRPADHRSRSRRWLDAVATLTALQAEYAAWLETLPTSLHDSVTGAALQAICELDLGELQAIEPPRGFGRD